MPTKAKARAPKIPLHDQAYEKIKHEIITLGFRPGEYLNEALVSKLLRIGRTPVRQALNRLMLEGMVDVIPRKGVIVKAVSLDDVIETIDVRIVNETYCAKLAAVRADDNDIAELTRILDQAEEAVAVSDSVRQMTLDRDFHNTLSRAARNTVLADCIRTLHDRSLRFWFISLRDPAHHLAVKQEHRAILGAIKARDAEAAGVAVRSHIESFRANIMRHILGERAKL
ncbi:MAG: GntR family transcriptional regulator [Betaproteobacteria bacterium]|nr:GntR family transcriptional regulator [Betaproteobacteria bacterium]MBI2961482.1 GntR family transcriptional regulator [Betaproteobacteria bacterium]